MAVGVWHHSVYTHPNWGHAQRLLVDTRKQKALRKGILRETQDRVKHTWIKVVQVRKFGYYSYVPQNTIKCKIPAL